MNWLDIVIIVLLVGAAIGGIINGLIKTIFGLAGMVVGIILAGRLYVSLADQLGFISNENIARVVAFILIFTVICVIAAILGFLFTKIASAITMGWLNRVLGACFGILMGCLLIGAILVVLVKFAGIGDFLATSVMGTFLVDKFPVVLGLLPAEFDTIKGFFD